MVPAAVGCRRRSSAAFDPPASACGQSSLAFPAWRLQVEQGRLEDSPKQPTLQRILRGVAALTSVRRGMHNQQALRGSAPASQGKTIAQPNPDLTLCSAPTPRVQGAKVCVVGQPHSFFTLYQSVVGAGLAVCQLDRDSSLARAPGASRDAAAAAVAQACAGPGATCVLAPAALVAAGGFPLAAFQAVVVYASEPTTQAALRQHLDSLACPLHWLEVPLAALQQQHGAAGSAQLPASAAAQRAGPGAPAAVQHAARTTAAAAPQPAAAAAAGASGGRDWPLIISSEPSRPIR